MSKLTVEAQILARVESFAAELNGLIRQAAVEAVGSALSGGQPRKRSTAASKATASGRRAKPKKKGKRIRRTAADLEALSGVVHGFVKENKGSRLEQISAGVGVPSLELKKPVIDLLAAGRLRKTGQKRGTQYFAKGR